MFGSGKTAYNGDKNRNKNRICGGSRKGLKTITGNDAKKTYYNKESKTKRTKAQNGEPQNNRKDNSVKIKEYAERLFERFERAGRFEKGRELHSDFEKALGECYFEWKKLQRMEAEEAYANIILSNYYANEKIRSKLQDYREYVEHELEEEETAENVVLCGFNTCMNLAWLDYQRMKSQLAHSEASGIGVPEGLSLTAFMHELAYMNETLDNLYQIYSLVKDISKKPETVHTDKETYERLYKADMEIQEYNKYSDVFGFQGILEDIQRRNSKKQCEITEAKRLKSALDDLMQETDLLAMKDKESELHILQSRYRNMNEKVKSILDRYNRG